jgi:hypothetical protein
MLSSPSRYKMTKPGGLVMKVADIMTRMSFRCSRRQRSKPFRFESCSRHRATSMIRAVCGALILSGLVAVAVPSSLSFAQPNDPGVSAPKDAAASAPERATTNKRVTPHKHRYWRHRGGKHPHFGSRRVRTQ